MYISSSYYIVLFNIIIEVEVGSMDIPQEGVELLWEVGLQDTGTVACTQDNLLNTSVSNRNIAC